MEETMVSKYGIPFLGLPYEVWELGPVQKDVFVAISNGGGLLGEYVNVVSDADNNSIISVKKSFDEDEFSQVELDMMNSVLKNFGNKTANQLINYLHRKESLWYKLAVSKGLLKAFKDGLCNCSEVRIDLGDLLPEDKKEAYEESLLIHSTANEMKAFANV
ncbi:MAG: SocA family protein [Bacteroidales bacterium]|nr:SocA family protein [Bacteroidales bacterium]